MLNGTVLIINKERELYIDFLHERVFTQNDVYSFTVRKESSRLRQDTPKVGSRGCLAYATDRHESVLLHR